MKAIILISPLQEEHITFLADKSEKTFKKIMISEAEARLSFELDFEPQKILIDKDGMILKDSS